ncbi:MAG TPA: low molecular weight phosphotyrosine protein phosphatase [Epsilonproteobacteria bacterium]|nr:low molecular weight phosphotyrosine protein phosphatase [Campylobacterota bacterium]
MSKKRILFVCLGNICRSPLAEGIAKAINKEQDLGLTIFSSGTSSWHEGELPCEDSIRVAKLNGIDISQLRARQVKMSDKELFDYVIAMDRSNKENLEKMGFTDIHLLGEFANYGSRDVPDPYFFEKFDDGIKKVYMMIEQCIQDLLKRIDDGSL